MRRPKRRWQPDLFAKPEWPSQREDGALMFALGVPARRVPEHCRPAYQAAAAEVVNKRGIGQPLASVIRAAQGDFR